MTLEMIQNLAQSMACKISLVQMYEKRGELPANKREFCFYSEWKGMEHALKLLNIDYTYDYNESVTKITAVIVEGYRFEID